MFAASAGAAAGDSEGVPRAAGRRDDRTFLWWLVAAMVLGNAVAVHIVLAEAIAVSFVSLVFLAFLFGPMKRWVMALDDWVVSTNRRLWLFVAVLFILPAIFLTSGIWIGPITN